MFLIYLDDTKRSPVVRFYGKSGRDYKFRWSEAHKLMLLEGRELDAEEFGRLAPDVFGADQAVNFIRPVPKYVGTGAEQPSFALRPFNASEVARIASRIGVLEVECARLRGEAFLLPSPQPLAAVSSAPVPAGNFSDYDPDADVQTIGTPVVQDRVVASPIPSTPPAFAGEGCYDPDEV